jgi:hypothetical protein
MNKLAFVLPVALTLAGCGGGKVVMHMAPVNSADVNVSPTELVVSGKKLWLKLMVQNNSKGTLMIQRDQIVAHLPNGQTLSRAVATGGWGYGYAVYDTHAPYVLPPGAMHPVNVEYEEQGFKWKEIPSAQIDFAGAVTRDGQPVTVPPFVVSQ